MYFTKKAALLYNIRLPNAKNLDLSMGSEFVVMNTRTILLKPGFEFQEDFSLRLQGFQDSKSYIATQKSKAGDGTIIFICFFTPFSS